MTVPAPELRRHFLPWDRPLTAQAAAWLAADWRGDGPLDLSGVLVLVSTRQAGRRLREALAGLAGARQQAVFPPRVLTPEALLAQELGPAVASRVDTLVAWTEVVRGIEAGAFRAVFPVEPPARSFAWALRLAQQLARLQAALAENGWRLADVAARGGPAWVEADRWRELAELERLHDRRLAERGLQPAAAARIAAARRGEAAGELSRIVVFAVPDPPPLALERLGAAARAARMAAIDVVVFAPEAEAAAFDRWGRPVTAHWAARVLALPEPARHVRLCADPAAQAARVAEVAARYAAPEGVLAVGLADPEITPLLENELARAGRAAFDPEGRPFAREALGELLARLAAVAHEPGFAQVGALARCPDVLAYLKNKHGAAFSAARWLAQLDELWARHLPADLAAARAFAAAEPARFDAAARGLDAIARIRERVRAGDFARSAAEALRELFGGRHLDLASSADARRQAAAAAWVEVVRACVEAQARGGALAADEAWDLALGLFGEQRWTEEKPPGALELQGWLELLWEDAPHLVVAGCNDGRVPETVADDPFLPDGLRQRLGLRTNAERFARDAYVLQAIAACRATAGRLDLLYGKTSAAGDPLRPARLLLRCGDEELPERVGFLFRSPERAEATSPWQRAWKLAPRAAPPPEAVTVTALRAYLRCPFRFYLRHVLELEPVDAHKSELDARDFGTLCHAALERIGREPALRDCTEPAALRVELLRHLDRAVEARYGRELSLPLLVQVESARQRVGKLAELQAAERAAGWEIIAVEQPFQITLAGLGLRGRIDRIDRHAATGALRVLDYKTSDSPVTPADAHLAPVRLAAPPPDWARHDAGERPRAWIDLQLPLYRHALAALGHGGTPTCGYFNLPKAAGETTLALWADYTPELHAAALRCAETACAAIRTGQFWPPNETLPAARDEYAALFHHGAAESVAWAGANPS